MIIAICIFGLTILAALLAIRKSLPVVFALRYPPPRQTQWQDPDLVDIRHRVEVTDDFMDRHVFSKEELMERIDRDALHTFFGMIKPFIKTWETGHLEYARPITTIHYFLQIKKQKNHGPIRHPHVHYPGAAISRADLPPSAKSSQAPLP